MKNDKQKHTQKTKTQKINKQKKAMYTKQNLRINGRVKYYFTETTSETKISESALVQLKLKEAIKMSEHHFNDSEILDKH